jgi:hypothetical protein
MMPDEDGQPACSCERNKLGVHPGDIQPTPDGSVVPERKGMSVNVNPMRLPPALRPERFRGGHGRLPLYAILPSKLGPDLTLHPASPRAHAVVQPARPMHVEQFQRALWRTRGEWSVI